MTSLEELKKKFRCSCPIEPNMTFEQLMNIVRSRQNCKDGQYICPVLDRELIRARIDRDRKDAYAERRAERARMGMYSTRN